MSITKGMVVISEAGHDKGDYFYVKSCEKGFGLIVNGKTKKHINPKRKNIKHLSALPQYEIINEIDEVSNKKISRLLREIAREAYNGQSARH
ncbi:MAG: KOW domain-containing RNA-binding protein [Bacillota bacterium]|nr:KOW domain-containing RNA-binding protein [Bacillota bacterium]